MWEKTKAWFKNSLTILWARITVLLGAAGATAVNVWSDGAVQGAISTVGNPKILPWVIIGMGVLTELFRRRTL